MADNIVVEIAARLVSLQGKDYIHNIILMNVSMHQSLANREFWYNETWCLEETKLSVCSSKAVASAVHDNLIYSHLFVSYSVFIENGNIFRAKWLKRKWNE